MKPDTTGHNLQQGKVGLDMRKKNSQWLDMSRLPRKTSPSLETFKTQLDKALSILL